MITSLSAKCCSKSPPPTNSHFDPLDPPVHPRSPENFNLVWTSTYRDALDRLSGPPWDVILVDYDLGDANGLQFIHEAKKRGCQTPIVVITGRGRYEIDLQAMEAGAADYITKEALNSVLLERVIRYSIERHNTEEKLERLVQQRTAELQQALEELRIAEEELRQQNEELIIAAQQIDIVNDIQRQFSEDFQVAYLLTDLTGRINRSNQGAAVLFGSDNGQITGKLLSFFVQPEDQRLFVKALLELKRTKKRVNFTLRMRTLAGPILCSLTARLESNEEALKWIIHPIGSPE